MWRMHKLWHTHSSTTHMCAILNSFGRLLFIIDFFAPARDSVIEIGLSRKIFNHDDHLCNSCDSVILLESNKTKVPLKKLSLRWSLKLIDWYTCFIETMTVVPLRISIVGVSHHFSKFRIIDKSLLLHAHPLYLDWFIVLESLRDMTWNSCDFASYFFRNDPKILI